MFAALILSVIVAVPNPQLTPGSFCSPDDPDFKEFRYAENVAVCERNVTTQRKDQIMRDYGYPVNTRQNYEIDHCIPLSLGGSNHDDNLWPQPRDEHNSIKKNLQIKHLYNDLQTGRITYEFALSEIRKWCPEVNN